MAKVQPFSTRASIFSRPELSRVSVNIVSPFSSWSAVPRPLSRVPLYSFSATPSVVRDCHHTAEEVNTEEWFRLGKMTTGLLITLSTPDTPAARKSQSLRGSICIHAGIEVCQVQRSRRSWCVVVTVCRECSSEHAPHSLPPRLFQIPSAHPHTVRKPQLLRCFGGRAVGGVLNCCLP